MFSQRISPKYPPPILDIILAVWLLLCTEYCVVERCAGELLDALWLTYEQLKYFPSMPIDLWVSGQIWHVSGLGKGIHNYYHNITGWKPLDSLREVGRNPLSSELTRAPSSRSFIQFHSRHTFKAQCPWDRIPAIKSWLLDKLPVSLRCSLPFPGALLGARWGEWTMALL